MKLIEDKEGSDIVGNNFITSVSDESLNNLSIMLEKARIDSIKHHMRQLFQEIKHGDQEHQDWLENKIENYIKSNIN